MSSSQPKSQPKSQPTSDARPLLVLSNDDGIDAPGIEALRSALEDIADCRVVAPAGPQSGVGHALSDGRDIHVRDRGDGRFAVSGTPADCARLALTASPDLLAEWREARESRALWLVSGINQGANLGVDAYVSGTVAAAREAAILGFRALAISQYVRRHASPDWTRTIARARPVLQKLLTQAPADGAIWNVNLPHPPDESDRCEIVECLADPSPHPVRYERQGEYFSYAGDYHNRPRRAGYDVDVCMGGRIAVSQLHLDGLPSARPPSHDG
jgi:5'-nucleotidase